MNKYTQEAIDRVVENIDGLIDSVEKKKHFFSVSAWQSYRPINIYARCQLRYCGGECMKVITVANIEIEERFQRQGVFKELLVNLEQLVKIRGFKAVLVESINNHHLRDYLLRNGFKPINDHEQMIAPTLYREVQHEK